MTGLTQYGMSSVPAAFRYITILKILFTLCFKLHQEQQRYRVFFTPLLFLHKKRLDFYVNMFVGFI